VRRSCRAALRIAAPTCPCACQTVAAMAEELPLQHVRAPTWLEDRTAQGWRAQRPAVYIYIKALHRARLGLLVESFLVSGRR
jgi:hypothetical protein